MILLYFKFYIYKSRVGGNLSCSAFFRNLLKINNRKGRLKNLEVSKKKLV